MKAPNGRHSRDGSIQARRHERGHSEEVTPNLFYDPKFCYAQKNLFKIYDKHKNLSPLKCILSPKTLKPVYVHGSATIVSEIRIFCFEARSTSRCSITSKTFFINHH